MNGRPTPAGDTEAERRTSLANERTQLAWWRTGLTAIAVALGVGRVLPELAESSTTTWPYTVLGVGFALYGIALIGYGTRRARALDRELGALPSIRKAEHTLMLLTVSGVLLGFATVLLILFE
jgi:putative membrane protein